MSDYTGNYKPQLSSSRSFLGSPADGLHKSSYEFNYPTNLGITSERNAAPIGKRS